MKRIINNTRTEKRAIRHNRIRSRISGTATIPRLSVFRSLKNITAQLIDDEAKVTLCHATTAEARKSKEKVADKVGKVAEAYLVGKILAEKAQAKKIALAVFDRGGYRYHGRVAAVADGARENGLKF